MMKIGFNIISSEQYRKILSENKRFQGIVQASLDLVNQITKGNYHYSESQEKHEIIDALALLGESLMKTGRKEQEQRWIHEGLAMFMGVLQENNQDLKKLSEHILSSLIKYVGANQGALFLVNHIDQKGVSLDMLSCYAYGRKKFIEKSLHAGQGILGQAYLEKGVVYMTEVPSGYTQITSGLGEATPRSLLIVPFKSNEEVLALLELASFEKFLPHEIQFIEKLGENIASIIATVKVTEKTTTLLRDFQQQTEELKAQEEEMRQNVEELTAMQETQVRLQNELKHRLRDLENAKKQLEEMKKAEVEKMKKQNEVQARIMNATLEKYKKRERQLLNRVEELESKTVPERI